VLRGMFGSRLNILTTGSMMQALPSPTLVIAAWVAGTLGLAWWQQRTRDA